MLYFLLDFLSMFLGLGLLPMRAVRLQLGELLAADATTLAPAVGANKIMLFMNNPVLTEDLVIGDLTAATFTGYAAKAGATGTQLAGIDPFTGDQLVTITAPVGGWRWEATDAVGLPQTIYGYALIDNAGAVLLAAELLPTPIPLTTAGQQVDLGAVVMTFVVRPVS